MRQALVIGAGLGGLSCAISLKLAGLNVHILEQNQQPGGRANRLVIHGFTFDTGPSLLNYPWVFENLFRAASRDIYDYLELIEVEPGIRFYWPDGEQLQLSSRFDLLREEFQRFEPGAGPALSAWLERAGRNYRLSFERLVTSNAESPLAWLGALRINELAGLGLQNSLYRQLGTRFRSNRIREALGSYAMYLGGSPFDLPGLFEILPFGEINYGLWIPKGGIYALVEAMTRLAVELGVEITTGNRVNRIRVDDGKVSGVETKDGQFLNADLVVSNCDLPSTDTQLLSDAPAAARRKKRAAGLPMTPGVMTFYWCLKGKPHGLSHHSIFFPEDYRASFRSLMQGTGISSTPPFYISIASASDPGLAPEAKSTMFVLIPTPVLSRLKNTDLSLEAVRLKGYVIRRLQHHGVEFNESVIESEVVYTPQDWCNSFSLYDGSAFGAAHQLLNLGPWRPANRSRDLPGLFYVGASTTPGTGMPLVTLGGEMTARRVVDYVS
jgi:phytoene desaturase